jgi:hypothetical protein
MKKAENDKFFIVEGGQNPLVHFRVVKLGKTNDYAIPIRFIQVATAEYSTLMLELWLGTTRNNSMDIPFSNSLELSEAFEEITEIILNTN